MKNRILGIDYGSKRIGIALSDETNSIAFGKNAIDNDEKCLDEISGFIKDNNVSTVLLGYPLNLKGDKTRQTLEVESFEKKLDRHFTKSLNHLVTIIQWDERFTSKMAFDSMLQSGMKKSKRRDKENIDIISASLMLQSYLDFKNK
ncbi:MAG: Holliday junction resolvase RuvX [Ignavibacteria bacterium]